MKFPSKRDWWIGIVIWSLVALMLWVSYQSVVIQLDVIGLIISVITISLVVWMWFGTGYRIEENQLVISYGPIKRTVNINDIQSIRFTTNPFVAPALSIYRIELNYNKFGTLQVSPKDRQLFIHELLQENPKIQIKP